MSEPDIISLKLLEGKELCIYCRGGYGLKTYFQLRDLGIPVACFADADEQKQGYVIDSVFCISYEAFLLKDKEKTIVLVCKKEPEDLIKNFREKGFLSVYSYEIVAEMVREYPEIELNDAVIGMINSFRQKLYQLLKQPGADAAWNHTGSAFGSALGQLLSDAKNRGRDRTIEHC